MASSEECIQNPSSPPFSPQETPPGSPSNALNQISLETSSHNTSIHGSDKGWAYFESDDNQGLISEKAKCWDNMKTTDTSSISSEAESLDDVWTITDEQRDYYVAQFKTMQPDTHGVITGGIAKEFFEKSKLPVQELSKIWQLSDVNRDGALSLQEFCTAMHLVVLRRNEIELPNHLPPSLMPYIPLSDEPFAADLPPGSTLKRLSPSSPSQWQQAFPAPDSPTSSSVSSPGTKPTPLSFEFKPVTADIDTKIIHPVALRMSPDAQVIGGDDWMKSPTEGMIQYEGEPPSVDAEGSENLCGPPIFTDTLIDYDMPPQVPVSLHSRPRPTPKKAQSFPAPGGVLPDSLPVTQQQVLLPPMTSQVECERSNTLALAETNAPPPPPRAKLQMEHSCSTDGTQLIESGDLQSLQLKTPPAVPPRPSPKDGESMVNEDSTLGNFADFSQFGDVPQAQDTTDFTTSVNEDDEEPRVDCLNHNRGRLSQYMAKHTARDMKLLKGEIRKKKKVPTATLR